MAFLQPQYFAHSLAHIRYLNKYVEMLELNGQTGDILQSKNQQELITWDTESKEEREEDGKIGTTITESRDTRGWPKRCDAGQALSGEVVGCNEPGKSW